MIICSGVDVEVSDEAGEDGTGGDEEQQEGNNSECDDSPTKGKAKGKGKSKGKGKGKGKTKGKGKGQFKGSYKSYYGVNAIEDEWNENDYRKQH